MTGPSQEPERDEADREHGRREHDSLRRRDQPTRSPSRQMLSRAIGAEVPSPKPTGFREPLSPTNAQPLHVTDRSNVNTFTSGDDRAASGTRDDGQSFPERPSREPERGSRRR